jgi:hypothetical protein
LSQLILPSIDERILPNLIVFDFDCSAATAGFVQSECASLVAAGEASQKIMDTLSEAKGYAEQMVRAHTQMPASQAELATVIMIMLGVEI